MSADFLSAEKDAPPVIRFSHITYAYGRDGAAPVLADVSLEVAAGEHVAVLGANGSGKSTLVRMVNALLLPDAGTVTVGGIDTSDASRTRELRERVGMVFQRPDDQIVATSVEDDVAFGPENLGLPREQIAHRVAEAIEAVGLSGLERREPHLLSGGQKQRLAIAGALAMRPAYLVLDEPTSMLDPAARSEVLAIVRALRAAGSTILHVTHDLADALDADRAVALERGTVVFDGRLSDLLGQEELLARCGLELPAVGRLSMRLDDAGAPVPAHLLDVDALVDALWP